MNYHLFKRRFLPFLFVLTLILAGIYFHHVWSGSINPENRRAADTNSEKLSKYDRMDLAMEHEWNMTHDPALGYIPRKRLWEAVEMANRTNNSRSAIPNVRWQERGPNNVGGRSRAVLFDPNDPGGKAVFAGSVAGGLWYTSDITISSPDWEPVNDDFSNLAIGTMTYDPSNFQTMYFGTGEGWYNADRVRGDGIWKSTDGGNTWSQLASTTTFTYIKKMIVDDSASIVYACSDGDGLQRSLDGGTTWSKILGVGVGPSTGTDRAADIEQAENGHLYASMGTFSTGGLYKSTDHGDTWTELSGSGGLPSSGYERVEIAVAPGDSNTVAVLLQDASSNDCFGIYVSENGGSTWDPKPIPSINSGGGDFTRGQAWYDLIAAIDPNDSSRIFIGGIDLFISEDYGDSWSNLSDWRGIDYQYVHADQHEIFFKPGSSQEILFGNDGGVYYTDEGDQSSPDILFKNLNYNTVQHYACAMHPGEYENQFLSGSQDNGSHRYDSPGIDEAVEVTGGDGAFCHIDQGEADYWFTSYVYNRYRRSTDTGRTFSNVDFSGSAGRFINPTDYDSDEDLFYAAWSTDDYFVWTNPKTGSSATVKNNVFSGLVSAVTCDPTITEQVWFGTGTGNIYKVTNAAGSETVTDVTGSSMPAAYVSCIEVDPTDSDHVVATFSSYGVNSVWETTNGGTTWESIEGNLPDMPIRWALFNPNNSSEMLLATESGVWSTNNINGSSTVWGASNTGLANVRTDMLQIRDSDNMVIAATHGRGLYSTDIFTTLRADFGSDKTVTYTNKPIQFYNNSYKATTWLWDFGDGTTSAAPNPSHTYSEPGKYTVELSINSGAATETKDTFIQVLPNLSIPYKAHFGGNMEVNRNDFGSNEVEENKWQRGSSSISGKNGTNSGSNAWVTAINNSEYGKNVNAHLLTPNFDFTASGTYTLSYYTKYDIEPDWDGYQVQYSTNKGDGWITLGSYPSFYNTERTVNTAFLHGEPFFSGSESSFTQEQIDVSFLAGNSSVAFRFVFKSDQIIEEPGVAIDDVSIDGPNTGPGADLILSQYKEPSGIGSRGIELWNISGDSIHFDKTPAYVYQYSGGGSTPSLISSITSGALAYGEVLVIGNSDLQTFMTNNKPGVLFQLESLSFSGDDALEVVYKSFANDIFGEPGTDPGSAWSANGVSTQNQNIGLQTIIFSGDTNGWSDPSLRFKTFSNNDGFGDPPATVYDGSQWTWHTPSSSTDTVNVHLLSGSLSYGSNIAMNDFAGSAGTQLTLNSGTITINGDFNNQGNVMVIEEDASMVMTDNNADVTGEITAKRTGTPYKNIFNYWSPPVSNTAYDDVWAFSGGGLTFNSSDLYTYDANNQQWQNETSSNTMIPGEGIAITGPVSGGTNQRTFTGIPNNGEVSFSIFNNGGSGGDDDYNLIGNPYASAIDAEDFLNDPENSELAGSIWYWDRDLTGTHATEDYAQWTLTGGLCPSGCAGAAGTLVPDEFIPSMQGFMVEAVSAGDGQVVFNNSHRVGGNNNKFFKGAPVERVWFVARRTDGPGNGILIGFTPVASDGWDKMYDGRKIKGNSEIAFYTKLNNEDFAIQGVAPLNGEKIIPVELYAGRAGQYTIAIDTIDGVNELVDIHLVNTKTDQRHDLRKTAYSFSTSEDDQYLSHFEIHFNGKTNGIEDPNQKPNFRSFSLNDRLVIKSISGEKMESIKLVNIQGQVLTAMKINQRSFELPVGQLSRGIYFLEVHINGRRSVRRILL